MLGELDIEETIEISNELESFSNDKIHPTNNNNENKDFSLDLKEINNFVELKVIDMLEKQGMSKNDIAKALGISRSTLWHKTKGDMS